MLGPHRPQPVPDPPGLQLPQACPAQQAHHKGRAGEQVQAAVPRHNWRHRHLQELLLLLVVLLLVFVLVEEVLMPVAVSCGRGASFLRQGPLHCAELLLQLSQLLRLAPLADCCADQDCCLAYGRDGDGCELEGVQEPRRADAVVGIVATAARSCC